MSQQVLPSLISTPPPFPPLLQTPTIQIIVSTFEEDLPKHHFDNAAEYAVETARHKAMDVARMCAGRCETATTSGDSAIDCGGGGGLDLQ